MSGVFGNRPPFKVLKVEKKEEYRLLHCESGFWHGPTEPGEEGYYKKERFIVDSRYPLNSVSKNVSFWPELAKALGAAA